MSIITSAHIENNPTLNTVLYIDLQGRLQIKDHEKAQRVIFTCDANSLEYKVVQVAMNASNRLI